MNEVANSQMLKRIAERSTDLSNDVGINGAATAESVPPARYSSIETQNSSPFTVTKNASCKTATAECEQSLRAAASRSKRGRKDGEIGAIFSAYR
jgi:hypothetical protein